VFEPKKEQDGKPKTMKGNGGENSPNLSGKPPGEEKTRKYCRAGKKASRPKRKTLGEGHFLKKKANRILAHLKGHRGKTLPKQVGGQNQEKSIRESPRGKSSARLQGGKPLGNPRRWGRVCKGEKAAGAFSEKREDGRGRNGGLTVETGKGGGSARRRGTKENQEENPRERQATRERRERGKNVVEEPTGGKKGGNIQRKG